MKTHMENAGFRDINIREYKIPIGAWQTDEKWQGDRAGSVDCPG